MTPCSVQGGCCESESGEESVKGVYDETSEPRSDSYPGELNCRSYGSQVTSAEEESSISADARSASGIVVDGVDNHQRTLQVRLVLI